MIDLKPAMLSALAHLPACTTAVFPREEIPLPFITIADESGQVEAQADGEIYLEEYIAAVDVYAREREEMEALAQRADAALSHLGMRRIWQQDLYDEDAYAFRKRLRYRAILQGDTIYQ